MKKTMDVQRKTSKFTIKRVAMATSLLIVIAIASFYALSYTPDGYKVSASSLLIGAVKRGDMVVEVRGNGSLVPRNISWIAANVDGRVESVKVKAGAFVNTGDVIAEMVNPDLVQATEELRWELAAKEEDTKALESRHESNLLGAQVAIVDARQKYEHAKLEYDAAEILNKRNNGSVSMLVYRRSKLATQQNKQSLDLTRLQLEKLKVAQKADMDANYARVSKLKNMLARSESQIRSLTVRATESGVIQTINLEVGQRISTGYNIARVARKDQLIAELNVPERQIRDVALGQSVTINTQIHNIQGNVSRIDPSVINGTVLVDVELTGPLPDEARPDLSIEGSIQVARLTNILYVPRPLYAQNNMPGIVYKLSADGKSAKKVQVIFGKGSADEIAISSGLTVADRIVLSSYHAWEHVEQISITR
ncbi:efflux RND transporter periplasmic adaptor subunit [Pectobacteriaceae bacterium C52]|nr:efflux RND transporter periplasmic adaptor subunit [Pectobacteriaceae bacterium C52]